MKIHHKLKLLALCVSTLLAVNSSNATNIVAGFASANLARNDDGSTGSLLIGFSANFFGTTYTNLYANNNGNLTFSGPLGTFTPFNLYTAGIPIIAPFFGDVDTRNTGSDILRYGTGTYGGHLAFGATWDGVGVGYYNQQANKLNKFQVVLENRSDVNSGDFDIHFFYDQIQWETGGFSGGSNGLGGNSARAGFSSGVAANSYEIPGSAVNGALLDGGPNSLVANSNIGDPGHWLFAVRNGTVSIPGVLDGGTTLALLGMAMSGMVWIRRKIS